MKNVFKVLLGLTMLFGYVGVATSHPETPQALPRVDWAQVSISIPPITTTTVPAPHEVRKRASRGSCDACINEHLWRIAKCESHTNPTDVSKTGKYRGAWQFSMATWEGAGGHEFAFDPINATLEQQFIIARKIYLRSGPSQWPVCQYH